MAEEELLKYKRGYTVPPATNLSFKQFAVPVILGQLLATELGIITVSLEVGTPVGLQFPPVDQAVFVPPTQVFVAALEKKGNTKIEKIKTSFFIKIKC
ncbi:MAG TPA: hypothetical protein PKY12_02215 [Catalimonadaceae bacterium]|nr:hypothetical protein [Catalimonadaceae bacterium]